MIRQSGSSNERIRKRAFRLTPLGRESLVRALDKAWRQGDNEGRMTRDWRARAMGLSPTTSDKIMRGTGVDHATLFHAFRALGADWEEEFAERIVEEGDLPPTEEAAADTAPEEPVAPDTRKWPRSRLTVLGIAALIVIGAGSLSQRSRPVSLPTPMPDAKQQEFGRIFDEANAAYQRADYPKALEQLAKARALADPYVAVSQRVNAMRLQADIELARGDYEEAVRLYTKAIDHRRLYGAGPSPSSLWSALGQAHLSHDEPEAADPILRLAYRAATREQDQKALPYIFRDLGSAAYGQHQLTVAEERFARALSLNADANRGLTADIEARQGLLLARQGRFAEGRAKLNKSLAFWSREGQRRWIATTERQLGEVEAMAGDFGRARGHFERALQGYRSVGDRLGEQKALARLRLVPQ